MAFRAANSNSTASATQLNCPTPGGTQAGDLLTIMILISLANPTITWPPGFKGWASVSNYFPVNGGAATAAVATKRLDTTDVGLPHLVSWGVAAAARALIASHSGRLDSISSVQATTGAAATGVTTTVNVPLVGVSVQPGDDLVWFGLAAVTSVTGFSITPPTGFTNQFGVGTSPLIAEVATLDAYGGGSTGLLTGTAATITGDTLGLVLALPVADPLMQFSTSDDPW